MSGIVGMIHRDGSPILRSHVEQMLQAIARRGPDGHGIWVKGPIGLGHRLLFTTPESLRESQPLTDPVHDLALVWDGRLDNRSELLKVLESGGIPVGSKTDPELALGAYRVWGEDCPHHLLGDFAFALWDGRTRTLFCVRDRLGLKPFHYSWDGERFVFSSEIKPLLLASRSLPEPDDGMILAFLLREFREQDHERTLIDGIRRLPPGSSLSLRDGRLSLRRYWAINPVRETHYARDEEYAEHFRTLFQEAVRCRLRSYFPIAALLSGGLDSSAIVCTAHTLGRGDTDETFPPIEAFNLYGNDPNSDERVHFADVIEATGLKAHAVPYTDPADPLKDLGAAVQKVESPIVEIGCQQEDDVTKAAVARGCRIFLSGDGGDQLLDETGYLSDLLVSGRLWRFVNETWAMAGWYGGNPWEFLEIASLIPVPPTLKYWGKRILRGVPPGWMNKELARTVGLRERVRKPRHRLPFASYCQSDTYLSVTSPYYTLKLEVDERAVAVAGMEIRYPFLDSRLVEFVLSIPGARRTREGVWKALLRTAMSGTMPESVRLRSNKGHWAETSDRALSALCRRTPPAPLQNVSGRLWRYLDPTGVHDLVRRYLRGNHALRYNIWFMISLDHWLANVWGKR